MIAGNWIQHEEVMENVWLFYKQASSTVMEDVKPFTPEILEVLVSCYDRAPHPTALETARQLHLLFGNYF